MLTKHKSFCSFLLKPTVFLLIFLLFSSILSEECTEQWKEIELSPDNWTSVDYASIIRNQETGDVSFEFNKPEEAGSGYVAGAVWHDVDFSQKKGLHISFRPQVTSDESFGKNKYPQGFAIVFTSSSTDNLIGEKDSGIGYEGIINAVVFEFDFLKQAANDDFKKPHFSVLYNISGPVSSRSTGYSSLLVNRENIPNFYDNSLDGYYKNVIFEIQLIGNRILVKSNRDTNPIVNTTFTAFQQLLEQEGVRVGITSSINNNRRVSISDFKISEISAKEKGSLSLKNSGSTFNAGEKVILLYSIKSTCGEKLKIYSNEYLSDKFILKINDQVETPDSITFNKTTVDIEIAVLKKLDNIYTATVEFKGDISSPTKFTVQANDVIRIDLCEVDEKNRYTITSELNQTEKYFYISLCSYDQFGNPKKIPYDSRKVTKIKYPNNLAQVQVIDIIDGALDNQLILQVPVGTFGEYEIFNEDFIDEKKRYLNLMPKSISPEKSEVSILYENNIIQDDTDSISLRIKLRDNYGRHIPTIILDQLKCSFSESTLNGEKVSFTKGTTDDYVILSVKKPTKQTKYTFVPKVSCTGIELTTLYCGNDPVTKINNCEVYYPSGSLGSSIKAYSDFLDTYITFNKDVQKNHEDLIISLDEKENKKLTDIILLDDQDSIYFQKTSETINAKLDDLNLNVIQIGYKIAIVLPEDKDRGIISTNENPSLSITIGTTTYTISVKFYYLDHIINNINPNTENPTIRHLAFYKQTSLKLKAAETFLLFDIYEMYNSVILGTGSKLDKSKVELIINDKKDNENSEITLYNNFISVIYHGLKKEGIYKVQLNYEEEEIQKIEIEITAKNEAYSLGDKDGKKLESKEISLESGKLSRFTLLDKFGNVLKDNQVFNAFAKIKLSNPDTFVIKPNFDGKIHMLNNGKASTNSITLTLFTEQEVTYTIKSAYTPSLNDIDPLHSYGIFEASPFIKTDASIELKVVLKDKYGNTFSGKLENNIISAFVEGINNKKEIVKLEAKSLNADNTNKYIFKGVVGKVGDFSIHVFFNNYPIECKGCNLRIDHRENINPDNSKAILYLMGNKRRIPIPNHISGKSIKAGLMNNNKNIIGYFEQRDAYLNEIKDTKTSSFSIAPVDKSINIGEVTVNNMGTNEEEKGFIKITSGGDSLNKMPEGLYIVSKDESVNFYIYITPSEIDTQKTTPTLAHSMILTTDNKIYGKTDIPGSFILDLRTENYKRINNVDKAKITIVCEDEKLKYKIADGPENGLLTVFLIGEKPGKYEFTVNYDGKKIIEDTYQYICGCGFEKSLKNPKTGFLDDGNYIFFTVTDKNDNLCNDTYNFNDLSQKEYADHIIKATGGSEIYKTETYYNPLTSTFVLYFNRHVSGQVTLSSDFINIDSSSKIFDLTTKILDENHFIVKRSNNKLTIKALDDNYKGVSKSQVSASDFDVSLIRILNDDFVVLKNDFTVEDDLTVNSKGGDDLLKAKGKYQYIVYYKGNEIFCDGCIVDITSNEINIKKTKIYHKEGNNNYIESNQLLSLPLYKANFPFFKINLMTGDDNLVISSEGVVTITLTFGKDQASIKTKYATNGNIYVYLDESGRNAYLNLKPMTNVKLKVTYSNSNYEVSYYLMDHYVKKPSSIENCAEGAIPTIVNKQPLYVKRVDEELELEMYISGCAEEESTILTKISIKDEGDNTVKCDVIPTDIYGGYLLFLSNNLQVTESKKYTIINKNSKSEQFVLSILPGYEIKTINAREDKNLEEVESDKLYTYFLAELKDSAGNIITNVGRNLFANDIDIFNINDLPYKLTYDNKEKAFRVQVPITGVGKIEVKRKSTSSSLLSINVGDSLEYQNSYVDLKEDDGTFTATFDVKDEFYNSISSSEYISSVMFQYITINPMTDEMFIYDVKPTLNQDKFKLSIPGNSPKYSVYGFIPLIRSIPQVCPSCLKKNNFLEYVYSLGETGYLPHKISEKNYLIQNYDVPIFLYYSHNSMTVDGTNIESEKMNIGSNYDSKFYIISNKKSDANSIKVTFTNGSLTKNLNVNFIDYSKTGELDDNKSPSYSKIFGYKAYMINILDTKIVSFFVEIRDAEGKLIGKTPQNPYIDSYSDEIKKVNLISTCFTGVFYVRIVFSKSGSFEYNLQFVKDEKNDNFVELRAISAFPNQIVLSNKMKISLNIISYDLVATNSNAEEVCDERLNLYIENSYSKSITSFIGFVNGKCLFYIKLYGDAIVKSNIDNFNTEINNIENRLFSINPLSSSLKISHTLFSTDTSLKITFEEKSPSLSTYNEDEIIGNKELYAYQYLTPTKFKLIKSFSGLYSTSYTFSSNKFGFQKEKTYILIGNILDCNTKPKFIHYHKEKDLTVKTISAVYFEEDKRTYSIPNFNEKLSSGSSFQLNLPLLIRIKFLDKNGYSVDIGNSEGSKLKSSIVLMNGTSIKEEIHLIIRQYNDNYFFIRVSQDNLELIKHLPTQFSSSNEFSYFLKIAYSDDIIFYSLIDLKYNNYQTPFCKKSQYYAFPSNEISFNNFEAYSEQNTDLYILKNNYNEQHICLYSNSLIFNLHLDPYKIKVNYDGCEDIQLVNSYMGCFAISASECTGSNSPVKIKYNEKTNSNNDFFIRVLENDLDFEFSEGDSPETVKESERAEIFVNSGISLSSSEYLNVFINGEKISKKDLQLANDNNGKIKITIPSSIIGITNPKDKNITVTFYNGMEIKKILNRDSYSITVEPIIPDANSFCSNYKYKVQDPLNLQVGDNIKFYFIFKDSHGSCFYGDFDKLSNLISFTATIDSSQITVPITSAENLIGYSQCEKLYLVDLKKSSRTSGNLEIKIKQCGETYNLYISPKDIDPSNSKFTGDDDIIAGETGHLVFTGTDPNGNKINYFDLLDKFDIKLINSEGKTVENKEENYRYKINAAADNSKLNIDIKINLFDLFEVRAVIDGKEVTLESVFNINVKYGVCSTYGADPKILPIDHRTHFYSGETLTIQVLCRDTLGNIVAVEGKELFLASIKKKGEEFSYDYTKTFKDGQHLFTFIPPTIGTYNIDITLNGKKYGHLTTDITALNNAYYTCMDKRQFEKLSDCTTDDYRKLLKEILGEEYVCESGAPFKCNVAGVSKCVEDTNQCDCSNGAEKTNGFCYPVENNPLQNIDTTKRTCKTKLAISYPEKDISFCKDGTCRFDSNECETQFECPIGFKSCGVRCILLSENCEENVECGTDEVLCWDLSCAESYDTCPTRKTCPSDKVLCPDGSCQKSGHCFQPLKRTCESNQYQCPDFTCVNSKKDCIKTKVCSPGFSLCESGSCQQFCKNSTSPTTDKYICPNGQIVDNSQLCPSDMYSPSYYVKCPNGGVAHSLELCKYVQGGISITCPRTKPILCPDYECVEQSSDCNVNVPSCPPHKPYQCWNNECRASFDDCPTIIQCKPETPILCQSGLCVKSPEECKEKKQEKCTSNYRCFDGNCVASMELCPTDVYCGEGKVRCWNGACVNNVDECRSSILSDCPSDFSYRCPDGSCRKTQYDCSTKTVCPANLPIKCYDNSCRANKEECPPYTYCGTNKISCPDGTCASNYDECNTVVTCYPTIPFLCFDNSCKAQLTDCPEPPKCSKNEFLCPDGSCKTERKSCDIFDPCEATSPTRCEINTCTESYTDCDPNSRTKRCPIGYVLCANGECKTTEYLCENYECPKNMPYFCKEGVCVHDKSYCDMSNGCPYNRPNKCANGTCVKNENECVEFTCTGGKKYCPDGSCIEEKYECPLVNGCYKDRPFKCADGTCINPETSTCSMVLCPVNAPYKCPNGYCVTKSSDCVFDISEDDSKDCEDGLIMCVDGRCVESSDYCRPSFECETGYKKCADGTCRVSEYICPMNVQCPPSRPIRCGTTQLCVKDEHECTFGMICPLGMTKCQTDGYCKKDGESCTTSYNTEENGCYYGGVKCPNGRCVKSLTECLLISNGCPDDNFKYLCSDGECVDSLSKCIQSEGEDNGCKDGKIRCKTGRCVENNFESIISQCSNNLGCPLKEPYRCANGLCAKSQSHCNVTIDVCDISKPYSCYDRSCVSDPKFCKSTINCNSCKNGFCVKDTDSCSQYNDYCPTSSPILCPSGACADDIRKCGIAFKKPICSDGEFYCALLNQCLTKKSECLSEFLKLENKSGRRLLEDFVDPSNDKDIINTNNKSFKKIVSFIDEEEDKSDSIEDKIEGVFCYDGTIAPDYSKCPIVPPCKMGQYRCENGACMSDLSKCPTDENYKCQEGKKKCPDGMCHKDCSEIFFQGCEVGKYQCTNGFCVEDKYDCIGHSMCKSISTPYRCINGECKSSPEECEIIERLDTIENITYSFNKINKVEFEFAYNVHGRTIGRIEIPSNGIKILRDSNYSRLYVREIPTSILNNSVLYNNTAEFLFNISNSIPGSEGILTFENSVMSPVFKFYYDTSYNTKLQFKINGKINIAHNEYEEAEGLKYYDYCLAKLRGYDLDKDTLTYKENSGWECVERQTESGQTEFQLRDFGVYAVILNPSREKINYFGDSKEKNFFLENVKIILIVLAIIIVVIALVFYIFLRVTRYRQKYHENRSKILLLQQQKQEYENMTTDIFGQTLGDNINGIVYKANPAYTVTDEIKKSGSSLEEEIEKLQIECRNVNDQNDRLQKDIENITEQYKTLSASIENMNK